MVEVSSLGREKPAFRTFTENYYWSSKRCLNLSFRFKLSFPKQQTMFLLPCPFFKIHMRTSIIAWS